MQQIGKLLKNQNLTNSGQSLQQTSSGELSTNTFTPIKRERVTKFFVEMAAIYPYGWMGQFADSAAMRVSQEQWWKALQDFDEAAIERGLKFLRSKGGKFPPNIPEFVQMCEPNPEDFGILDEETAFDQYRHEDYSDPIVNKTMRRMPEGYHIKSSYYACNWDSSRMKKEFLAVYRIFVKEKMNEEPSSEPLQISQ